MTPLARTWRPWPRRACRYRASRVRAQAMNPIMEMAAANVPVPSDWRLQPMGGKPGRPGPDGDRECACHSAHEELCAPQQVARLRSGDGTRLETRHFATEDGGRHAVDLRHQRLQQREERDQAISLDTQIADVERDERDAHQRRPGLPGVARDQVSTCRRSHRPTALHAARDVTIGPLADATQIPIGGDREQQLVIDRAIDLEFGVS